MTIASKMTLDEFLRLSDEKPALEYACGEVVQKPMPVWDHSTIQGYFLLMLGQFLLRSGLGRALPEFRCIFGPPGRERALVPDVAYVAKERYPEGRYLRTAPDIVIEILSPDQNTARFLDKVQFYLLNGVRLGWVIDPEASTVAVLAPGEEGRTLGAGDEIDGGDVLPGFTLSVGELFAQMQR